MPNQIRQLYEFGHFQLDISEQLLLQEGKPVALTPKAFDILVVLVQRSGRLVEKEELLKEVWAESFVEESNLTRNIYLLRKALGNGSHEHPRIETVPSKGYRFVADIRVLEIQDTRRIAGVSEGNNAGLSSDTEEHSAGVAQLKSEIRDNLPNHIATKVMSARLSSAAAKPFYLRQIPLARLMLLVFFLCLCIFLIIMIVSARREKMQSMQGIRSIAVLPFKLLDAGSDDNSLGLGITDSLISRLGNQKQFMILSTSAVMNYQGNKVNPVEVGHALGVDAVVTGTVQRDGERIRVTVQLIHVSSGEFLWAESLETQGTDIFKMQDIIAERVTRVLNLKLNRSGTEPPTKR
jgi:DNA-binding winged helix-turn-helix (wHTH) protein/TolB-like protein